MSGHRITLSRTVRTLLVVVAVAVCVAPLQAQTCRFLPTQAATAVEVVGQVSVIQGSPVALFVGNCIGPQQVILAGPDSYAKFQISDGSTFEVFNNTRTIFRNSPGNWKDLLEVVIGRIRVMIQHAPGVKNPNNVSSPTAVISVRGTVFDVAVEDEDGTTLVTVEQGWVGVRNITAAGDPRDLYDGDYIRVFRNQPLAVKQFDKGEVYRRVFLALKDAAYQVFLGRQSGGTGGIPGGGSAGGTQADKSKPGTGQTGDGGKTGTPPAPPTTGTPPPPPGGN